MIADPPSLAVRMLMWRLSPEWRDFILGDLEEEFRVRAGTSLPAARRWFWRQAVRCQRFSRSRSAPACCRRGAPRGSIR